MKSFQHNVMEEVKEDTLFNNRGNYTKILKAKVHRPIPANAQRITTVPDKDYYCDVPGVYYHFSKGEWRLVYRDPQCLHKRIQKTYSIKKYGFYEARKRAIDFKHDIDLHAPYQSARRKRSGAKKLLPDIDTHATDMQIRAVNSPYDESDFSRYLSNVSDAFAPVNGAEWGVGNAAASPYQTLYYAPNAFEESFLDEEFCGKRLFSDPYSATDSPPELSGFDEVDVTDTHDEVFPPRNAARLAPICDLSKPPAASYSLSPYTESISSSAVRNTSCPSLNFNNTNGTAVDGSTNTLVWYKARTPDAHTHKEEHIPPSCPFLNGFETFYPESTQLELPAVCCEEGISMSHDSRLATVYNDSYPRNADANCMQCCYSIGAPACSCAGTATSYLRSAEKDGVHFLSTASIPSQQTYSIDSKSGFESADYQKCFAQSTRSSRLYLVSSMNPNVCMNIPQPLTATGEALESSEFVSGLTKVRESEGMVRHHNEANASMYPKPPFVLPPQPRADGTPVSVGRNIFTVPLNFGTAYYSQIKESQVYQNSYDYSIMEKHPHGTARMPLEGVKTANIQAIPIGNEKMSAVVDSGKSKQTRLRKLSKKLAKGSDESEKGLLTHFNPNYLF